MSDGVVLRADLYLPDTAGPHRVIVIRTPYNKQQNAPYGEHFATRGSATFIQDVSGKHASDGEFDLWVYERAIVRNRVGMGDRACPCAPGRPV